MKKSQIHVICVQNMKIGHDHIGVTTPFYCTDGAGNLLLHLRSKECRDEHNRWDPGSGKHEFGMTLEQNVLDEVRQEYGCAGTIIGSLPAHDIFRTQNGSATHWVAVPFFVRVDPKEVKNGEPHKIQLFGWFTLDRLPQPLHTGFSYTLGRYRHEFDRFLKKN